MLLGSPVVYRAALHALAVRCSDDGYDLSLQRLRLGAARKALEAAGQYPPAARLRPAECKAPAAGQLVLRRGGSCVLVSCLYYLPFIAVAIAAGFMALLVRIVKNIFQQAIDMKAELDLTI